MPKIAYTTRRFAQKSKRIIDLSNAIITEYADQGFDLTLRQLYYQLVRRNYIPNNKQSYKRLIETIKQARLAGLIDWYAIVDRTRNLYGNSHWDSPQEIIAACANQYAIDKWATQPYRPEVWIEKDALAGIINRQCSQLDVPYFPCRGYDSTSEMWRAGQRLQGHLRNGQIPYIIHLGDHDPSGLDMTRDSIERLELFTQGQQGSHFQFERIALSYKQVQKYNLPPNPAKATDSRINAYRKKYGEDCWELDALEPSVINQLIKDEILKLRDEEAWQKALRAEAKQKGVVNEVATNLKKISPILAQAKTSQERHKAKMRYIRMLAAKKTLKSLEIKNDLFSRCKSKTGQC